MRMAVSCLTSLNDSSPVKTSMANIASARCQFVRFPLVASTPSCVVD